MGSAIKIHHNCIHVIIKNKKEAMSFPETRMQRYRKTEQLRKLHAETILTKSDFIYPIFINEAIAERKAIEMMPGIYQQSQETLLQEVERISSLGVESILLFGIPKEKDRYGSSAALSNGVIQNAIRQVKRHFPHLVIIADCCLCEYTSHGHCGVMEGHTLNNDETLKKLQEVALTYADSGVDIIAPSGMMDGMVKALRTALDTSLHPMVPIMSYAIKYASQFYGPFREAAGSKDCFKGNRKHHQIQPTQKKEALREALLDMEEAADYLIVKPGLPYLDIIHTLKEKTLLPVVAYQVSGEYSMLKCAAEKGLIDEKEAFREALVCMKRAGADLIITYYADKIIPLI